MWGSSSATVTGVVELDVPRSTWMRLVAGRRELMPQVDEWCRACGATRTSQWKRLIAAEGKRLIAAGGGAGDAEGGAAGAEGTRVCAAGAEGTRVCAACYSRGERSLRRARGCKARDKHLEKILANAGGPMPCFPEENSEWAYEVSCAKKIAKEHGTGVPEYTAIWARLWNDVQEGRAYMHEVRNRWEKHAGEGVPMPSRWEKITRDDAPASPRLPNHLASAAKRARLEEEKEEEPEAAPAAEATAAEEARTEQLREHWEGVFAKGSGPAVPAAAEGAREEDYDSQATEDE